MKKLPILFLLLTNLSFAKLNYELEVTESLSNPAMAIAKIKGYRPSVGDQVILPFTKTDYCTAQIQKVDGIFLLLSTHSCAKDKVKPGQRGIIKGKRISNRKKTIFSDFEIEEIPLDSVEVLSESTTSNSKKIYVPVIKTHKLVVTDIDLGSSTIKAEYESEATIGSQYKAESVFGEECKLNVIANTTEGIVLDSSDCSFERDIDPGELLTPL